MQTDISLRIGLLGAPFIEYKGKTVTFRRRKSLALIALAATERKYHSRDTIMALLWPESDQSHASALLRTVLWEIRHTPLDRVMETRSQHVGIPDDAPVSIDVTRFHSLAERHRASEANDFVVDGSHSIATADRAVSLYRGLFLDGFSLPGNIAFEEWIQFHRDVLQRRYIIFLNDLINGYETKGELDRSIEYAQRLLRIDEMDESIHRRLMRLYAAKGERSRAITQYESCVSILERELDVQPEQETETLIDDIREGRTSFVAPIPINDPPSQIPKPVTAFIGRDTEITNFSQLLLNPTCRLLTLSGLGGSGKTRLAMELAGKMHRDEETQVIFISLAPIRNSLGILFAIADALSLSYVPPGAQTKSALPPTEELLLNSLIQYLHTRRMIIVLDNFEHLLEHGHIIASILTYCPEITVIITSRVPTGISGEWIREIGGLSYPQTVSGCDDPFVFDAVRLFRELALRLRPDFSPDECDVEAIIQICQLVDGIPLGIELAVPWLQTMTCKQMAEEIKSNIDFLEKHHEGASERHKSLRAIFDQTWSLLEPEARSCFRKLSVFRGSFSSEAAGEVAGATPRALTSLVQRSLIRFNGSNRFEILEVIRQFAVERLRSVPRESDVIIDRHARYFLRIVAESESRLKGRGQEQSLRLLHQDIDNIRAAWKRAVVRGMIKSIDHATFPLFLFYDISSRFVEGASMFEDALGAITKTTNDVDNSLIYLLQAGYAWFSRYADIEVSERVFNTSITGLAHTPDRARRAFVLVLSTLHSVSIPEEERIRRLHAGREIFSSLGDAWGEALALEGLAYAYTHSNPRIARSFVSESLSIRQSNRDRWGISLALFIYGYVLESFGKNDLALDQYEKSAQIRQELGQDLDGTLGCMLSIARINLKQGLYHQCEQRLLSVKQIGFKNGLYIRVAESLEDLITLSLICEHPDRAWALSDELLDHISEYDLERELPRILALRGDIHLALGDSISAKHHYEQASSLDPDSSGALLGLGILERDTDISHAYDYFYKILSAGEPHKIEIERLLRAAVETAKCLVESDHTAVATYLFRYVIHHPRRSLHLEQYAAHEFSRIDADSSPDAFSETVPPNEMLTLEQILSHLPRVISPVEGDEPGLA